MKTTRKFLGPLEPLESRAVLSALHPAAHVLVVHGQGSLTTTAATQDANEMKATVALAGKFSGLGPSTGEFTVTIPKDTLHFTSSGVITAADGDRLDVNFSGNNQIARGHATKAVGHFQVNVTGGTGAFAHATGSGRITVTQNLVTGKETFVLSGKVHE